MAVSRDGYVARSSDDDMSWTGPTDKAVFRLLTSVGGVLGCGSRTWGLMPRRLPGRTMVRLSSKPDKDDGFRVKDLLWFQAHHPDGWLIGGQLIAMNALMMGLVDEAYVCQSDRKIFPTDDSEMCLLGTVLNDHGTDPVFFKAMEVPVNDVRVHVWKRRRAVVRYAPPIDETLPESPGIRFMDKCGCQVGSVCGNAACPHRATVTC